MLSLLFAVAISVSNVTNVCPTCKGVGRVDLPCSKCKGRGQIAEVRRGSSYGGVFSYKPCNKCAGNDLVGPKQKSSGKVNVKCPICNGRKKVSDEVLKFVLNVRKAK